MRTSQTPKNSVTLLWVAFLGNAAANSPSASFSLGMPYGVNAASIPYLHLSALEMAPKCDDANATMKSYRRLFEELSTIANMIETTDAHTNVPAGSNKDTHTTLNDVRSRIAKQSASVTKESLSWYRESRGLSYRYRYTFLS